MECQMIQLPLFQLWPHFSPSALIIKFFFGTIPICCLMVVCFEITLNAMEWEKFSLFVSRSSWLTAVAFMLTFPIKKRRQIIRNISDNRKRASPDIFRKVWILRGLIKIFLFVAAAARREKRQTNGTILAIIEQRNWWSHFHFSQIKTLVTVIQNSF